VKVFISWSGEKSKAVAQALNDWIPDVLQYVTPFMSDAGIDAGARPLDEIEQELGKAKFGIICVTSDNYLAPWLNFEAGAISKKLGLEVTRVAPLLVDLDTNDVNTPLKQFQMKKLDKDGVYQVIRSINKMALADGESGLEEARLTTALDRCWPALQLEIEAAKAISPPVLVTRTADDKIDEVLESVRLLTNEVELIRRMTRTTWERFEPSNWPRVPAGLTGAGSLRGEGAVTRAVDIDHDFNSEGDLGFLEDVFQIIRPTDYKLVGYVRRAGELLPTKIMLRADTPVPDQVATLIRDELTSALPGVEIQMATVIKE